MQLYQLITVLGLCLSQAHAMAITPMHDDAIKSFTMLVTSPDNVLEKSPVFSSVADAVHQKAHTLDHQQFHQEIFNMAAPLLNGHEENAVYFAESLMGYRQTADLLKKNENPVLKERLQIYRNAVYSQVKDLAHSRPEKFSADALEKIHSKLMNFLTVKGGVPPSDHAAALEAFAQKFKESVAHSTSPDSQIKFEHLSRKAINEQLEKTKSPVLPHPILVDGQYFQGMASHFSKAHHEPHFSAAVPAGMPVAATA
ncbi:hypothetical protein PCANC_04863 [Puccinia coronata f. sp. avenae]|nr:hypothetical protein PCANC_08964 [Puccinia coronata f. sp. avenae]PLW47675.1 hypothetical protein PCASD_04056 [Puccinia coronata f. sp. avenae]PLW56459.1 hypothetical protein PCANC_04863 [Puccinia coronata f. sp. avenae]